LQMLKPTAYLINVGRGELIQEEVLIEALRARWFAGAGIDVYNTEPLPLDSPFLELDNVILTPHWLPSTHRASRATRDVMVRNILRVARGLVPQNVLNPEVLGRPAFLTKLKRFAINQERKVAGIAKEN
jgi:phosphoglycerate dehydrogenase-like enzyme